MQPLKLTIQGRFWDSQLYKGHLYLFDLDGSLKQLDWNKLIQSFHVPDRCRLALECAFERGDYFYGDRWDRLFEDSEVNNLLRSKFDELRLQDLSVDDTSLQSLIDQQHDTPFPYAHNDSLIYNNQIYATSQSGVFAQDLSETTTSQANVVKLWDAPVSTLDIYYDVLALAAGDEGLFRTPSPGQFQNRIEQGQEPENISKQLCNDCNYISRSILAFGYDAGVSLVEFRSPKWESEKSSKALAEEYWNSESIGTVDGKSIFPVDPQGGVAWGSKNRMCLAKDGQLHVVQYKTTNPRRSSVATELRSLRLDDWKGSPVSADNAVFGAILEMDNCLVIVRSDGKIDTLPGEPTNWRVFPKSKRYTNHLHVIYDDRIEIMSFNHDYFVNQKEKVFGEQQQKRRGRTRA